MNINENNNFGLKDYIEYYEKQGYIFYDLSNIRTLKDYIDFEKYKRKNYDKLIIYVKVSSYISKDTTKFYKKIFKIFHRYIEYKYLNNTSVPKLDNNIYIENRILFFYKKKYLSRDVYINIRELLDIQNILFNDFNKCDICFDEECIRINICHQCQFQSCEICYKQLRKKTRLCCQCKFLC